MDVIPGRAALRAVVGAALCAGAEPPAAAGEIALQCYAADERFESAKAQWFRLMNGFAELKKCGVAEPILRGGVSAATACGWERRASPCG